VSDLVGNDVILANMETLLRETGDSKYRPPPAAYKWYAPGNWAEKPA
jgi:3-hydroxyacyl-CoA dehydrogenase